MGDTFFIQKLKCAYCGKANNFSKKEDFYSGLAFHSELGGGFVCCFCQNENKVVMDFYATKARDKKLKVS